MLKRVLWWLLYTAIGVLIGVYAALAITALSADRMIFQPPPASYPDSPQLLKIKSSDGKQIAAVYLPNPQARYTILFSHGNAEDIGTGAEFQQELHDAGFAVLAYDYHGYGRSEGTPTEKSVYQDEEAAYQYLTRELHVLPNQIIAHGRSLGAAAAIELASRRPLGGLIVQSGFTSAFRVLTRVTLLPWDEFPNLRRIGDVHCPVLFIHGTVDEVVPFAHGQALFAAANNPKQHFWVEGAGHNDLEYRAGKRYVEALQQFAATLPK